MELFFTEKGVNLIRAIIKQPLLIEYDPEKTKKVNAWLAIFSGFERIWQYFDYEVFMGWDAIILACKETNIKSLHMYYDGQYWFVMTSINS